MQFNEKTLVTCECGELMLPNVSTADSDGVAWICLNVGCGDYTAPELEAEDLEAVGVPAWLAEQLTNLIENLTALTPCPEHGGGYDCTPFCPKCLGNQFIQ